MLFLNTVCSVYSWWEVLLTLWTFRLLYCNQNIASLTLMSYLHRLRKCVWVPLKGFPGVAVLAQSWKTHAGKKLENKRAGLPTFCHHSLFNLMWASTIPKDLSCKHYVHFTYLLYFCTRKLPVILHSQPLESLQEKPSSRLIHGPKCFY